MNVEALIKYILQPLDWYFNEELTGDNNPCSGCGDDHDPENCITGFNYPQQ